MLKTSPSLRESRTRVRVRKQASTANTEKINRDSLPFARLSILIESCLIVGDIERHSTRPLGNRCERLGRKDWALVSRFQRMGYPDPPRKFVNMDRWPNTAAKNEAFQVFERLAALEGAYVGAVTKEGKFSTSSIPFLHFADDAQDVFDTWRCDLENHSRSGHETPLLILHLAKYRSLMPSLAGNLDTPSGFQTGTVKCGDDTGRAVVSEFAYRVRGANGSRIARDISSSVCSLESHLA